MPPQDQPQPIIDVTDGFDPAKPPNIVGLMAANGQAAGFDVSKCHECQIAASNPLLTRLESDLHQASARAAEGAAANYDDLIVSGVSKLRAIALMLKTGSDMLDKLFVLSGRTKPEFVQVVEDINDSLIRVLPETNPLPPAPQPAKVQAPAAYQAPASRALPAAQSLPAGEPEVPEDD
jgi:hypothetical protein